MAIDTRYFSTSGAGAADGTTWADRAALFSGGNWSSVITGYAFNSTNTLECLIGPGSYTCGQTLQNSSWANPPSAANPLTMRGCDSSGNRLAPANPGWTSAQAVDWDSGLPVIATTTNVGTISMGSSTSSIFELLKFTASGRNGVVVAATTSCHLNWCVIENSTSNSSAAGISGVSATNSSVLLSGTSFDYLYTTGSVSADNVRLRATGSASSGNRRGLVQASFTTFSGSRILVTGCTGGGLISTSTQTGQYFRISKSVIADNPGSGVLGASTASQTVQHYVSGCVITGNGAYGINADASRVVAANNRLRDNASGNITGLGNYPTDLDNYTTDSDDATEYVDASGGDYRIKYGSAIWGMGYGAGDEPASGGGGTVFVPQMTGYTGIGRF